MRCPDCGHSLVGVPDGTACSECGTASTAADREPKPLPSPWRLLWVFGWPSIAGAALVIATGLMWDSSVDGATIFTLLTGAVLLLLVGPVNTALQAAKFMKRLPRRIYAAPLLALMPRIVLVPLLAGLATIPINLAIGFGSCSVFVLLGNGRLSGS